MNKDQLIDTFVNYFFTTSDDDVKEYVKNMVVELLDQHLSPAIDVSELLDFLPPPSSLSGTEGGADVDLHTAVAQLYNIVYSTSSGDTDNTPTYAWMRAFGNRHVDNSKKNSNSTQDQEHSHTIVDGLNTLSISAPEFKPTTTSTAPLQEQYTQTQTKLPPPGFSMPLAAAVSALAQEFPVYAAADIQDIVYRCGGNMNEARSVLYQLENEFQMMYGGFDSTDVSGSTATTTNNNNHPKEEAKAMMFALAPDEFPSLGPTTSNTNTSTNTSTGKYWAEKAKAAAHLPSPIPTKTTSASTKPTIKKQIWESSGDIDQFSTGTHVAEAYADLRAEARDHARVRNQYFQQATQAYLVGNKALAKELGAKGRQHNERMKDLHDVAAQEIFQSRNKNGIAGGRSDTSSSSSSGAATTMIDLHGLHVSEAVRYLEETMAVIKRKHANQQRSGAKVVLRVVVGVGSHGKVRARVPTAVKQRLDELQVEYIEKYEGLLEVTVFG